ncbi:MAG: DUF1214 domain-containing protein [Pseudomonadota bacterium]
MKTILVYVFYLLVIVAGLFAGGVSALWMSGLLGKSTISSFATVNVNNWTTDPSIGAASADAYTRARIARHGLLALAKEEAIYFARSTDDDGEPLLEACSYELKGGPQEALWWSITLYDNDSRLPMNDDNRLSIDATLVGNTDEWSAIISSDQPDAPFWLSSRSAGQFDLTLRLYQPEPGVIEDSRQRLFAPSVQKVDCEGSP